MSAPLQFMQTQVFQPDPDPDLPVVDVHVIEAELSEELQATVLDELPAAVEADGYTYSPALRSVQSLEAAGFKRLAKEATPKAAETVSPLKAELDKHFVELTAAERYWLFKLFRMSPLDLYVDGPPPTAEAASAIASAQSYKFSPELQLAAALRNKPVVLEKFESKPAFTYLSCWYARTDQHGLGTYAVAEVTIGGHKHYYKIVRWGAQLNDPKQCFDQLRSRRLRNDNLRRAAAVGTGAAGTIATIWAAISAVGFFWDKYAAAASQDPDNASWYFVPVPMAFLAIIILGVWLVGGLVSTLLPYGRNIPEA